MRHVFIATLLALPITAVAVGTPMSLPVAPAFTRVAASDIPAATHPLEATFWEVYKARSIPGLSVAQVRPFTNILAAGPEQSPLLTYLGLALLAAKRPAESPYFGPGGSARIAQWVSALRPMEVNIQPSREETETALQAFDEFAQAHTASLNLDRAADELLVSPLAAMFAAQYLRADGQSAEFRSRWATAVSRNLERHARAARDGNRSASAAGLYLYAHWVVSKDDAVLTTVRYTEGAWQDPSTPLQLARKWATFAAWFHFWPAMDPKAAETKAVIDLLNHDPVLARANFVSALGLVPGDAATFGPMLRENVKMTERPYHVVAGNPPLWLRSGDAHADQPALWPSNDPPELLEARKQVSDARDRLTRELDNYRESRRLFALDKLRAQLREFDGVRGSSGSTPEMDSTRRALDNARASYSKDLRDGIYVGRSLERADTVYTREMNSMERRTREFEIERMERRLADQQREAQLRHEETVVRSRQRDALTDEIFRAEKLVDTRGHLAKVAVIQQSIESAENRYVQLLARQSGQVAESGLTAESNARAMFVRTRLGEVFARWYQDLEQKALTSRSPEDALEARWFLWLFDFPDFRVPAGTKTFFATREAEAADAAYKARGRPLAQIARMLLEPLAAGGPTRLVSGFDASLEPRLTPSSAWRQNQVEGLLNDTWFRFGHEPTVLREQIFVVVKALHEITGDDAITIESLRPWMRRFVALAPKETQRVALRWEGDPQTTALIARARE